MHEENSSDPDIDCLEDDITSNDHLVMGMLAEASRVDSASHVTSCSVTR